jgi:hypothetical protein
MTKVKLIFCTLLLLGIGSNCFSQYRKNAIVLELAGKSYGYFGVSYERYLTEKIHIGGGIGMSGRPRLYYAEGWFTCYEFTIPLYGAYAFGHRKHHAISEFGTTIRGSTGPNGSTNFDEPFVFISCGYEYKGERFFFRAPLYLTYIGRNEFFPTVVPWLGLSFGMLF